MSTTSMSLKNFKSIDDQQVNNIHQLVNAHLRDNPDVNLLNPGHFPALVNEVYQQVNFDEGDEVTRTFYNIVAMCAVGPDLFLLLS